MIPNFQQRNQSFDRFVFISCNWVLLRVLSLSLVLQRCNLEIKLHLLLLVELQRLEAPIHIQFQGLFFPKQVLALQQSNLPDRGNTPKLWDHLHRRQKWDLINLHLPLKFLAMHLYWQGSKIWSLFQPLVSKIQHCFQLCMPWALFRNRAIFPKQSTLF